MTQPNRSGLRSQLIISGVIVLGVGVVLGTGFAVVAALIAAVVVLVAQQGATATARRVATSPHRQQRRQGRRRPKRGEFWYANLASHDDANSTMAPCLVLEIAGGNATVCPLTKEDHGHRPNFLSFHPPPGSKLGPGSVHLIQRTVHLADFGHWAQTHCPPQLWQKVERRFPQSAAATPRQRPRRT